MEDKKYSLEYEACLSHSSKKECKSCDGFGRNNEFRKNLGQAIDIKQCYISRIKIEEYLGLKNE